MAQHGKADKFFGDEKEKKNRTLEKYEIPLKTDICIMEIEGEDEKILLK